MDYAIQMVSFMILFPFVIAALLTVVKNNTVRKVTVYSGCTIIIASAILFAVRFFAGGSVTETMLGATHGIDKFMLCVEFLLMILIIFLSFKYKKYYAAALSVLQTVAIAWLEITHPAEHIADHILFDRLTIIMCLIIGVVGSLICIYAVGYMTGYHNHHKEYKDRRCFFFPMLFVFIGAMFGLVLSDNLIWIYFFWEITSISSFLLIGYTRTDEAIGNSFRALWMNLLGGVGFAAAIIILAFNGIHNLSEVIALEDAEGLFVFAIALLAFAGLTKSAQMPFSRWLLGAMVAPTPTSALLHSATMVKAGVYMLIRLAPVMHNNWAGDMVALIGGFTFLITSMLAITHSDGKKVLAYSTVSNLGLITACAGIGMAEAVWAGMMLMIFHAVSKSMMFQTVGAIENSMGSRDIEDMHGLIVKLPHLALVLIIGIMGMFLAPFGMLISKWAVLKSFIDSSTIIGMLLVFSVCFGSAATLFYWTKWLCKVLAYNTHIHRDKDLTTKGQWTSLSVHAFLVFAICVTLNLISSKLLIPYVTGVFPTHKRVFLSSEDIIIMAVMIFVVIIVPVIAWIGVHKIHAKKSLNYMSGINMGDNVTFDNSFHENRTIYLAGWYMIDTFGEKRLFKPAVIISSLCIIVCLALALIGGVM